MRWSYLAATLLVVSSPGWSDYDPGRIKQALMKDPTFKIDGWDSAQDGWRARSAMRGLLLNVMDERSEMMLPYINMQQKVAAREQCETLGEIGLSADSETERAAIARVVKSAAQHHLTKFTDHNGLRFEVTPVLKGPYVRLSCIVRKHDQGQGA
ncbi:MAG: hypothetical protein OEW58_08180 [Gammaproteobacteria bacterium]|nr:hypothetical protein [Gammaproteobacteria bacterium]